MEPIPANVAQILCSQIRNGNRWRWYSFYGMACYLCYRFTKGDPDRMLCSTKPGNRGCPQVNRRYDIGHERTE